MDKSKQPKIATPEQNAEFNRQLRDVLINNGIALANTSTEGRDRYAVVGDETYDKFQNELRNDMLNVYRQLQDNTVFTRDSNTALLEQIRQNTDLICKQKERLLENETRLNAMQLRIEKLKRSQEQVIIDSSTVDKTIKDLEGKLNILAGQYKAQAERINKLEKLR